MYKYVSLLLAIRESNKPDVATMTEPKYEPDGTFLSSLPKSDVTEDVSDSLHLQETSVARATEMALEGRLAEELQNSTGFGLLGSRLEELRRRMINEEANLLPFGVYPIDTLKDESVLDSITASGTTDLNEIDSLGGRFQPEDLLKTPIEEMHHHTDELDPTRRQTYDSSMIQMLEEMLEDKMATFRTFVATDKENDAKQAKKHEAALAGVEKQLTKIAASREKSKAAAKKKKFNKRFGRKTQKKSQSEPSSSGE